MAPKIESAEALKTIAKSCDFKKVCDTFLKESKVGARRRETGSRKFSAEKYL